MSSVHFAALLGLLIVTSSEGISVNNGISVNKKKIVYLISFSSLATFIFPLPMCSAVTETKAVKLAKMIFIFHFKILQLAKEAPKTAVSM